ncbi:hypothetical protein CTM76_20720 [Photobacterium phosphoreum]|nr:hypothetical protein AYY25_18150 [Photobacterium phosphoreum]PSU74715.1 hypothetical protein CTM76_20720 [Photobacterium phosphoreum]
MENGHADALVVMLAMASPVHFTLLKKPESKDSGFFSSVENDNNRVGYYLSSRKGGTYMDSPCNARV